PMVRPNPGSALNCLRVIRRLAHPGGEEVRVLPVGEIDIEFLMPIEPPKARRAAIAGGAVKHHKLNPSSVAVHHEMLEFKAGATILAIERRPSTIVTRHVRPTAPPGAIGHDRSVARVSGEMNLAPMPRGLAALHFARQRSARRVVDPA